MRICMIPLDERPVNTRYPRMLAAIAGAEVVLPPAQILSKFRKPADCNALTLWLHQHVRDCDVLIVGCEMLGYGGLLASRTGSETAATILGRLDVLETLKSRYSNLRIFGFNVITRIPGYNSAVEEPDYWGRYGASMHSLSQLLDRAEQGDVVQEELLALRNQVPEEHVNDFLKRRLRNHSVNLGVMHLAAEGIFDLLVISSDDTSPYGLGSSEKRWLRTWGERLNLGSKLLMYPGADEVGSILVARAINQHYGRAPGFHLDYAVPGGEKITAAFEDTPVRMTAERQIVAAGASILTTNAEITLLVNPPRSSEHGWVLPYTPDEQKQRIPSMQAALARLAAAQKTGLMTAVADVAHSNGSDPVFVKMLQEAGLLTQLDAYSAWNTAGNSIGTTVAQACIAWHGGRDTASQKRFIAHRLIEDWLYMADVRQQATEWLISVTGQPEPVPERVADTEQWIEEHLAEALHPLNMGFRIVPNSLRLPWGRTFEIDFELE